MFFCSFVLSSEIFYHVPKNSEDGGERQQNVTLPSFFRKKERLDHSIRSPADTSLSMYLCRICDDSISYTAYSNFSPTHCMDKIFLTDSVPLWLLSYAVHSCLSYLLPCFSICACVILLIITHFNAFRIVLIYDKIYALSEVI